MNSPMRMSVDCISLALDQRGRVLLTIRTSPSKVASTVSFHSRLMWTYRSKAPVSLPQTAIRVIQLNLGSVDGKQLKVDCGFGLDDSKSSDALLLRCSDAEVGQDRASGVD